MSIPAPETRRQVLFETTQHVLENAAFLFAAPEFGSQQANPVRPAKMAATVEFGGPWQGCLHLCLTQGLAEQAATNMLAADDENPDVLARAQAAVNELANIVCGHILPLLAGSESEFHILAPETGAPGAAGQGGPCRDAVNLLIEGQPVLVALTISAFSEG